MFDGGVFEINEAFASQTIHCVRMLELDIDKVNLDGGAITSGRSTGATAARQAVALLAGM